MFSDPTQGTQTTAWRLAQTGTNANTFAGTDGQLKYIYGQPINGVLGANGVGGLTYTNSVLSGSGTARATG